MFLRDFQKGNLCPVLFLRSSCLLVFLLMAACHAPWQLSKETVCNPLPNFVVNISPLLFSQWRVTHPHLSLPVPTSFYLPVCLLLSFLFAALSVPLSVGPASAVPYYIYQGHFLTLSLLLCDFLCLSWPFSGGVAGAQGAAHRPPGRARNHWQHWGSLLFKWLLWHGATWTGGQILCLFCWLNVQHHSLVKWWQEICF